MALSKILTTSVWSLTGSVAVALAIPTKVSSVPFVQSSQEIVFSRDRYSPLEFALEETLPEQVMGLNSTAGSAQAAIQIAVLDRSQFQVEQKLIHQKSATQKTQIHLAELKISFKEDALADSFQANPTLMVTPTMFEDEPPMAPSIGILASSTQGSLRIPTVSSEEKLESANRDESRWVYQSPPTAKAQNNPIWTAGRSAPEASGWTLPSGDPKSRKKQEAPRLGDGFSRGIASAAAFVGTVYKIEGPLELSGGLALTELDNRLRVFRSNDQQVFEEGSVDIQNGKFEILVQSLEGEIVAELVNNSGAMIGQGRIQLKDVAAVENLITTRMVLAPFQGASGFDSSSVHARANGGDRVAGSALIIKGAGLQSNPVGLENATAESSFLLESSAPGHFTTNTVASYKNPQVSQLWPEAAAKALSEVLIDGEDRIVSDYAIIWGRVLWQGQPVRGAAIEISEAESGKIIYFTGLIPDPGLKSTGENGLYAVLVPKSGLYAVRATIDNHVLPAQMAVTFPNEFTQLNFEITKGNRSVLSVVDGVSGKSVPDSIIEIFGAEKSLRTDSFGEAVLTDVVKKGRTLLEVSSSQNYPMVRSNFDSPKDFHKVYVYERSWLDGLLKSQGLGNLSRTGIVALRFDELILPLDFEIQILSMDGVPFGAQIYFDPQGNAIQKQPMDISQKSLARGVVVSRLPFGPYHILVRSKANPDLVFTELIYVEPEIINTVAITDSSFEK